MGILMILHIVFISSGLLVFVFLYMIFAVDISHKKDL